ncbi:hypothetical protein [Kouleothrix sp.]|uniref:hypothetical protein n=1 Tax=Kouleothrix sp. TaxID=2779161 RepID=UPI00391B4DA2
MDDWLDKVYYAHDSTKFNTKHQEKDDFPTAREILQSNTRLDTRSFDWPEMSSIVNNISIPVTKIESSVCSIVQLFAFCHFLLERCCFTTITPISEENAFDMFQSLNATGTPLTAIETFKPLVHHKAEDDGGYQGSLSKKYFDTVDELFENSSTFPEKTKLTNEFLNTLALVQNGNGLPNQFSKQRRWLKTQYDLCDTKSKREEFIRRMSDLANYWEQVIDFDPQISVSISGTEEVPESDRREAALCVLYLRDANHVRANTVLSRFYALMSRGKPGYDYEFVSACRAIGAFYTIWRAAYSNTGLDAVYERLLQSQMSWERGDVDVNSAYLKGYLLQELHKKNIDTKQNWMIRAKQELRYDLSQRVCKFALFVAAHDTVPDSITPGLMKAGLMNTYPYLDPIKWRSGDFKSIETYCSSKTLNETIGR